MSGRGRCGLSGGPGPLWRGCIITHQPVQNNNRLGEKVNDIQNLPSAEFWRRLQCTDTAELGAADRLIMGPSHQSLQPWSQMQQMDGSEAQNDILRMHSYNIISTNWYFPRLACWPLTSADDRYKVRAIRKCEKDGRLQRD